MTDYEKVKNSLKRLEEQYQNYIQTKDDTNIPKLHAEAIRESVIQRFETSYDTIWKHLKKYLEEELGLPEVPSSPKPVFRMAAENPSIIGIEIDKWLDYSQARIDTTHDYNEKKSLAVLEKIQDYLENAISLYETMSGETWK